MRARYIIISVMLVLTIFIVGCATYKTYSSSLTNEFTKSMMKDHPQIESLKIHYSTSEIEFAFKINTKMDEKEVIEIFKAARSFFTAREFQDELIQKYDKIFEGNTSMYPTASIAFYGKDVNLPEYRYLSEPNMDSEKYHYYDGWGLQKPDVEGIENVEY